jgi:hypothetical protein
MHQQGVPTRHAITVGLTTSAVLFLAARANAQQPARMQAGGLAPPPRMQNGVLAAPPAPADPNAAERQLDEAEHSDSGRGLEFVYFDVGGAAQFVSLDALSPRDVYIGGELLKTSSFGPSFSAGAGLRLLFFTVGPRFRFGTFSDWDIWTLNIDLGWHIPLGRLEPYAFVSGGFAKLAYHGAADSAATGFNIRVGGGLDYYMSNVFSVGGKLDVDLLSLSHRIAIDSLRAPLTFGWSSLGLVVTPAVVAGLHF